jgi:large subunit ribosomal protein L23
VKFKTASVRCWQKANKVQIKKAIEAAYGVTILSVNTMNVRPDRTTKYTKSGLISGKTNAIRKQLFKYKKEKQLILQQYLR